MRNNNKISFAELELLNICESNSSTASRVRPSEQSSLLSCSLKAVSHCRIRIRDSDLEGFTFGYNCNMLNVHIAQIQTWIPIPNGCIGNPSPSLNPSRHQPIANGMFTLTETETDMRPIPKQIKMVCSI